LTKDKNFYAEVIVIQNLKLLTQALVKPRTSYIHRRSVDNVSN